MGCEEVNYTHPVGWQVVVREGIEDAVGQMLVVIHRFYRADEGGPEEFIIDIPIKSNDWKIVNRYGRHSIFAEIRQENAGSIQCVSGMDELDAAAVRLTCC